MANGTKILLDRTTAYLAGVVVGDGNLSSSVKHSKKDFSRDCKIRIDLSDKQYLLLISEMIKSIIQTKSEPHESAPRMNRKPRMNFEVRNKSLYIFFNEEMFTVIIGSYFVKPFE